MKGSGYSRWWADTNTTYGRSEVPNLVYVTAFLNLNEDRSRDKSPEKCFAHFRTLAASGIPICLYMSPEYETVADQFATEFPNVKVAGIVSLQNTQTYKYIKELGFDQLPEHKTDYHDTFNFMVMMHAKTEFVRNLAQYGRRPYFAWIDFSICHVLKNPTETLKKLLVLSYSQLKFHLQHLVIPGCHSFEKSYEFGRGNLEKINWRFCGGLFFGSFSKCLELYNFQKMCLEAISSLKILPWEVNTWAIAEREYHQYWTPDVYMANHDDSMITNLDLTKLVEVSASIATIPSRIPQLKATIDSLIGQVDHLYVNLCESYIRFPNYTKDDIKALIKQYLGLDLDNDDYHNSEKYQNLCFVFGPDYGPATKYLGSLKALDHWFHDNQWIFFGDDDQEYHPNLISRMLNNAREIGVYQNRYEIVKSGSGGIIHGYVGNLVHKSVLKGLAEHPLSPDARYVDDQWMSIFYFLKGIPIRPSGIEQYGDIFASLSPNGYEKIGTDSLASLGNRDDKVAALEFEFGVHFLKNGNLIRKTDVDSFDITKYVDRVVYINLDYRLDRRVEIEGELNKIGLPSTRFPAIATPGFGILGCGYSHLEVLKQARTDGLKNVLIFEDDFQFLVSKPEFVFQLRRLFEDDTVEFDVCMLSYNLIRHEPGPKEYLNKALEVQTASGYIVNHTMFNSLIELYEFSFQLLESTREHWIYANDQIWKKLQKDSKWYCFKTRLGKQRPSYSDNGQSWAELDC